MRLDIDRPLRGLAPWFVQLGLIAAASSLVAADAPSAETPASASAMTSPLPLFDGRDLSSWWIDPTGSPARVDHGELVIHNRIGTCFHAEVGGMSWDDYEVSCEFRLERDTSTASRDAGSFGWNLQLCPHDTLIYAQLLGGGAAKIAYVDIDGERPFVDAISRGLPTPVALGEWHRYSVLASGGVVATRVDAVAIDAAAVPTGTKGMFGMLVNFGSDAEVRLRNLTVAFLKPTTRQLQEYARPASVNWEEWIAARPENWDSWSAARRAAGIDPEDQAQWPGHRPGIAPAAPVPVGAAAPAPTGAAAPAKPQRPDAGF